MKKTVQYTMVLAQRSRSLRKLSSCQIVGGDSLACQVGITTDPERRKKEWQAQRPTLRNWMVLAEYNNKSAAPARETQEASRRGCNSGVGGTGPEYATWHVYYFEY